MSEKTSAAVRKQQEIQSICAKREVLRAESSEEELRAEISKLESALLEGKQAAMISELCKVQEANDILLNLSN